MENVRLWWAEASTKTKVLVGVVALVIVVAVIGSITGG